MAVATPQVSYFLGTLQLFDSLTLQILGNENHTKTQRGKVRDWKKLGWFENRNTAILPAPLSPLGPLWMHTYYAQWHVWRSTRGETLIYKDQGLDPFREYENASNKQDKDVVFLNHPCRWWPQGTMLGASPSPITGHHDPPRGKLDISKDEWDLFFNKFDANPAQTLSLALLGASLVLVPRCVCQGCMLAPRRLCSGDVQVPVARSLFTILDSPPNLTQSPRRISAVGFPSRRSAWLYAVIWAEYSLRDTRPFDSYFCDSTIAC